jgi:hypothetical protein
MVFLSALLDVSKSRSHYTYAYKVMSHDNTHKMIKGMCLLKTC